MAKAKLKVETQVNYEKRFFDYLEKNYKKIFREIMRELLPIAYDEADRITTEAVNAFYEDFTPNKYHRKEDLKNAFDFGISDGWNFKFALGSDFMKYKHHQSNDLVYDIAFEHGYHGGSWGIDKNGEIAAVPYWRTPAPGFTHWYPPGYPAPQSAAPRDYIIREWNSFARNVFRPMLEEKICSKCIDIQMEMGWI